MGGRSAQAQDRTLQQSQSLQLETALVDLDAHGYAVLPGVLSPERVSAALTVIQRRAEALAGHAIDLQTATEAEFEGLTYLPYLLYEDPLFQEIVLEPKPLNLITHLLGESCLLSSIGSHFKGPGGSALPLHSDNGNGMPAPFPSYSQVANVNYALTPYSREAGALAVVPGSHKWARQPTVLEQSLEADTAYPHAIALDLQPGDAVVWHGNLWHGSFSRQIPGVRVNLAVYFCRQYLRPQERHEAEDRARLTAADPDGRLAVLLGAKQPYGWRTDGPDYHLMAKNPAGLYD